MGTTANSGIFRFAHVFQVPLVLVINGFLAWHYYSRGARQILDQYRFGPLLLHTVGTMLVLVQPIFDSPGGIIYDMKHGFPQSKIKPPKFTQGGFWHHGYLMAFFQVTGLLCIVTASLWSAGVFSKGQRLLEEQDKHAA